MRNFRGELLLRTRKVVIQPEHITHRIKAAGASNNESSLFVESHFRPRFQIEQVSTSNRADSSGVNDRLGFIELRRTLYVILDDQSGWAKLVTGGAKHRPRYG